MAWTNNQQKVIDARDCNILVSAAAGSGKTAVLVERIITRVLDENNPLDVDKLLVVTFTNAAATEMRERILKAIEGKLKENPESEHLQRQQAYIHTASITTMHSFCLRIVRENFNRLNLDPTVRIADTGEIQLLKSDVIKDVIEEYYQENDEKFKNFVRQFERKDSDNVLEEMISELYTKSMGYPWPEKWLDKCLDIYKLDSVEELEKTEQLSFISRYSDAMILDWIRKYKHMISVCSEYGLDKYMEKIMVELEGIDAIYNAKNFNSRRVKFNFSFLKLSNGKGEKDNPEIKDYIKGIRDEIKKEYSNIKDKVYSYDLETNLEEIKKCREIVEIYVDVTKSFIRKFEEAKRERNIIDFNDFEHYAIRLLTEEVDGEIVYTDIADEIADEFDEVMVDEYQDSNLVQETIIDAVSKNRRGIFNRFMVGDVKQSIYGFRGAEPSIFVEKYNKYLPDENNKEGYRIILDKNFRSRKGVIDTTNFIFSQIMGAELGGIDYDENNMLYKGADFGDESGVNIDEKSELYLIDTSGAAVDDENEEFGDVEASEENASGAADEHEDNTDDQNSDEDSSKKENKKVTANEAEARFIAKRIKEIVNVDKGMMVYDKNEKKYRKAKYSDIVILVRTVGSLGGTISNELTSEGIPCQVESKAGYFKTLEIRTIVSLLKIIDNPRQDVPMVAVLRAPFVDLSNEEIAKLRVAGGKNKSLYEDVILYSEYDEANDYEEDEEVDFYSIEYDEALRDKLLKFISLLNELRMKIKFTSIYDIISEILYKTSYLDYVSAMPSGKQRLANINLLKEKAAAYENGSYQGLFNFIRYIEKMDKCEIDMGEASILSESDDAVRIMTIHKSKGLEFPIVFLSYLNRKFNQMDTMKKYILDFDYGIAFDYINPKVRYKSRNILRTAINLRMRQNILEEEIRVFYVACTRAREKLIMTANGIDQKKILKMAVARNVKNVYLSYTIVNKIGSLFDMVGFGVGRNNIFEEIYCKNAVYLIDVNQKIFEMDSNISLKYIGLKDIFEDAVKEKIKLDTSAESLRNIPTEHIYLENEHEKLANIFGFQYAYKKETDSNAKFSVSDIKMISIEKLEENEGKASSDFPNGIKNENEANETNVEKEIRKPEFIEKREVLSGAARGTAYHTVFELFDFDMEPTKENIIRMLDDIENSGRLSKEERDCIKINDVIAFTKSDLGIRMKRAYDNGNLFREAQFVMGLYESQIEEFKRVANEVGDNNKYIIPDMSEKTGDIILIQGIIDVYFIEDGKAVIADYKTDRIDKLEDLKQHYYVQLELYKQAVCQITGLPVEEKILYSVGKADQIIT